LQADGIELGLVDDFDGDLLARGRVLGKFDLGEVALADGLEQPVFADVGLLEGPTPGGESDSSGAREPDDDATADAIILEKSDAAGAQAISPGAHPHRGICYFVLRYRTRVERVSRAGYRALGRVWARAEAVGEFGERGAVMAKGPQRGGRAMGVAGRSCLVALLYFLFLPWPRPPGRWQ
jgi:hypothetical protein